MIYLATNHGVIVVIDGNTWQTVQVGLEGQEITCVTACEGIVLAGTRHGIFRSNDEGQNWLPASSGLNNRHVRWLASNLDEPGVMLAGTEPAGIFLTKDGANSWLECPEVSRLRDDLMWFLPYSPEAGCVRGFAFHGTRAVAAVEVGGVLVSNNGGQNWQLAGGSDGRPDLRGMREPLIHPDVHSIEIHPSSADLVFAPTGGGFYRSLDGGQSWKLLYDCYCRAVWVDQADARHMVLGPAGGVDSNGRIEETRDGGETWQLASSGLQVPWRRTMVERFCQIKEELLAVLSNGEVYATHLPGLEWRQILTEVREVNAIAADGSL